MAYTDLSSTFVYRLLLTHQLMDQLAENDKVFNNLLTAATDFDNNLRFNNAKYLQGEIAAGSTYKKLIGLDASNVVQLGESGTEVRVPADPTNALGVATKQYVEALQMFQLQARATVSIGAAGRTTAINITGRVIIHAITLKPTAGTDASATVWVTVDGTELSFSSPTIAAGEFGALQGNFTMKDMNTAVENDAGALVHFPCNTSMKVEAQCGGGDTMDLTVVYSKVP